MSGKEAQLTQLLQPTVEAMGYVLWGIELMSSGKRPTLRLYIEADAGISAFPDGDNIFNWVGTIEGAAGTVRLDPPHSARPTRLLPLSRDTT